MCQLEFFSLLVHVNTALERLQDKVWLINNSSMFDFLVQCLLTDLVQDIVASHFDSNAFIKAYISGIVRCDKYNLQTRHCQGSRR